MDIPKDLLQEIFIRLPYTDVANFKCVCRSWYNLLSHPDFTRLYASRTPYAAVFAEQVCLNKSKSFSLLEFGPNGEFNQTPINPMDKDLVGTENRTRLLSSRACSGDHVTEKLYLSDMFSGECVEVAEISEQADAYCWSEYEYKISYVPEINTHKILRISYYDVNKLVKIFTVGIDREWRIVNDPLTNFLFPLTDGVSFRGFYHWIRYVDDSDHDSSNICTFDFSNEKCSSEIPFPKPLKLKEFLHWRVELKVFNDRISLIDASNSEDRITVWTMEEYGVADSWSKKVVLRLWLPRDMTTRSEGKVMYSIILHPPAYNVVTVLPNRNIVLYRVGSCGTFIYVNTAKKQSTKVNVPGVDDRDYISSNYARFYPLRLI